MKIGQILNICELEEIIDEKNQTYDNYKKDLISWKRYKIGGKENEFSRKIFMGWFN